MTVGRLIPKLREAPIDTEGTKTITPGKGEAVGMPKSFVGVTRPVVVKTALMLPTTEVTVGRLGAEPLGVRMKSVPALPGPPVGRPEAPVAADDGT